MTEKGKQISLVSIIVPVLNEEKHLEELFSRTKAILDSLGQPFEFIVVDDGSTDNTANLIQLMSKRFHNIGLVRHRRNHGKSIALMQGFAVADGDVAIMMDGDLQDEPENIPKMLEKITWNEVKTFFQQETLRLAKKYIG